jgi:hypothetical protein
MTIACQRVMACSIAVTFAGVHGTVLSSLRAQELRRSPLRVSPLFSTTQVYDSNLFSTSVAPQSDFITRVSPGIESEYRSARFSLLGHYVLDLERFAAHPELTSAEGRQQASIDLRTSRSRRLAFAVDGVFARTRTPGELSAGTGLTLARATAERVEVHPTIVRQVDPITEATLDYTWTDERLVGGLSTRAHRPGIRVDRHVSRRDVVGVNYGIRMFFFETDERLTSHAVSIGWTRELTRRASVELRGGPVLTDGAPAPEVLASMRYRPGPSEMSITYARTQSTLVGFAGIVDTQSVTASAAYSPRPRLQIRIVPGLFRSSSDGRRTDAGRLAFEAERPMTERLSLRATYEAAVQRGNLTAGLSGDSICRHLVALSVVAAPASRRSGGRLTR